MSGRISNISRELYPRGLKRGPPYRSSLQTGEPSNPPSYAIHHDAPERSVCDDPFSAEDALLEPCDTACIKTISRNPRKFSKYYIFRPSVKICIELEHLKIFYKITEIILESFKYFFEVFIEKS